MQKKIYRIGVVGGVVVGGGGQVNNSGTLLGSKFQSATNYSDGLLSGRICGSLSKFWIYPTDMTKELENCHSHVL